eukprot:TRINITY_DN27495_c0_g1_i1.p2 TRINITY_DN27495_c0_g1~~TRINITY_DN27495_c0_g1_i1.p2  ORF type:complete len:216 (+),score=0.85 TRINITY_DN27495_c0_g1_i1:269-916(+)
MRQWESHWTETFVEGRLVNCRVVNAECNSGIAHALNDLAAPRRQIGGQQDLEHMPVALFEICGWQIQWQACQLIEIQPCQLAPTCVEMAEALQLPEPDRRRDIGQIGLATKDIAIVGPVSTSGNPLQSVLLEQTCFLFRVHDQAPAFTRCHVLVRMEAESDQVAETSYFAPAPGRAQRLRRIFDHAQTMPCRQRIQVIAIDGETGQIDRDDGARP